MLASRLSIVFFVPWITQGRGGTENVGSSLANEMAVRGHKVVIYTFDDLHRNSVWNLHSDISLEYISEVMDSDDYFQLLISIAVKQPDIIVGLHMNREFIKYVYCAYRLKIPVILSEHINPEYPRRIGKFNKYERDVIFSGADHIHLISSEFSKTIPSFLSERFTVINNTVREPLQTASPGNDNNIILCVARLVPRKNIDVLIKAFALLDRDHQLKWTLRIVGYGELEQSLKLLAKKLKVEKNIKFVGRLEDAYPEFENANIFVLPSEMEGFPLTSLEAMAHGIPVIGFENCSGLNEQVINGETGILCCIEEKEVSLAKALEELICDSAKRERFGEQAKNRFKQYYSQKIIYDQWELLIKNIVSSYKAKENNKFKSHYFCELEKVFANGIENFNEYTINENTIEN